MKRHFFGLLACGALFLIAFAPKNAAAQDGYMMPPSALAAIVDAPLPPSVSISPNDDVFLLMEVQPLPTIADLAQPELRLAGRRLNPRNNGPSRARYYTSLSLMTLEGGAEKTVTGLPNDPRISNVSWSPDGKHVAFTHSTERSIEIYLIDVADGSTRKILNQSLNAAYGNPITWMPDAEYMLVRTIDAARGPAPVEPGVPSTPVIQENIGRVAPARTYQDLLKDPYDEALFAHLITTQVLKVSLDGTYERFGKTDMITRISPSPDGQYVLTQTIHKPFSYLVTAGSFPSRVEVRNAAGEVVQEIVDLPLRDDTPTGRESVPVGIRSLSWRSDSGASLYWVEALDGGNGKAEAAYRDAVYELAAPFTGSPVELVRLSLRYAGISWSDAGFAMVYESWPTTRTRKAYRFDPNRPGSALEKIFDYSTEDRYANPGSPMTTRNEYGMNVMMTTDGGNTVYLRGTGASPEGNRPFIRKMDLRSGQTTELFRSEAPYYESAVSFVGPGDQRLLTSRESVSEPPNYFLRDLKEGSIKQITQFPHPYPELDAVQKEFIVYKRGDGVQLSATLYLPAGYSAATDGPLPAFVWAYPREFKSADAAGQISSSPYRFKRISYSGAVPYVTQGYAVIDGASMPVIGEGDQEPNDSFLEQLVLNAEAVVEEGVRRGVVDPDRVAVGGHSYGAFMTANLLAHSDVFRAGVARSGAYNRSLTPFGFQSEPRTFWEAPEIYFTMSPFMNAEKVNEPLLMIHGIADNNSGTFPIQSERFYHALKGMGKTARLVMLPHESHGYQARESVMHMIWETQRWLEMFVKNAPPREVSVGEPTGLPD